MPTIAWLSEHWFTVLSVSVYLIANVVPRPTGRDLTGPVKLFWEIIDRLCFFTAHGLPGKVKLPMTRTLSKHTLPVVEEQSTLQTEDAPVGSAGEPVRRKKKGHKHE